MRFQTAKLLNRPGGAEPFSFPLDVSEYVFDSVERFLTPVTAAGLVENHAGELTVKGEITAEMACVCARCLRHFERPLAIPIEAWLTDDLQDDDAEDLYPIAPNGEADLGEIANTALVLGMESRLLCREDCKGLCPKCGKDLNEGPCDCRDDLDPRLAVFRQLLENNDF
ncbi:MAG: YceD family protein [bacterium]